MNALLRPPFGTTVRTAVALAIAFGAISVPSAFARKELGGIAAVVNGKVITTTEYDEARKASEQMIMVTVPPGSERDKQLREAREEALDRLIERELVLYEFEKVGGIIKPQMIDEDLKTIIRERFNGDKEKFLAELRKTGMTQSKFRDLREKMIAADIMRRQQTRDITYPTPEQVRAAYDKNIDRFRSAGTVELRMITLSKTSPFEGVTPEMRKKLCDEVYAKLKKGADFAEMAKKVSDDQQAEKGGYVGVLDPTDKNVNKALAQIGMSLKSGEVSAPIESENAYFIVKADKRTLGAAKGFKDPEVYEACHAMALSELRQEAIDRWMKHLVKNARIKKMAK